MSTYTSDIAAVAHQRIEDRIRTAEARRVVRSARASARASAPTTTTAPAPPRPSWPWVVFTRRATA